MASLLVVLPVLHFAAAPAVGDTDDVTVDVGNFFFDPETVTITVGDTVTWNWVGGSHSVETSDGSELWCDVRSSGTCDKVFGTTGTYDYRCGLHPGSMTATVIVETPPPVVTILSPAPGAVLGGTFTFSGTATHGTGIVSVEVQVDDGPFSPATLMGNDWSADIDTTTYADGAHTLTARATSADDRQASATLSVTFDNPDTFDLRVDAVSGTTGTLNPAAITATIGNGGNTAAEDVDIRFQYRDGEDWITIGTASTDVPAGEAVDVSFQWDDPMRIGRFDVRAIADPENAIGETNEGNNSGTGEVAFWTDLIEGMSLDG